MRTRGGHPRANASQPGRFHAASNRNHRAGGASSGSAWGRPSTLWTRRRFAETKKTRGREGVAPLAWTVFARPGSVGVRARPMSADCTVGARSERATRRRMTRGTPEGWCPRLLDRGSSGVSIGDCAIAAQGPDEAGQNGWLTTAYNYDFPRTYLVAVFGCFQGPVHLLVKRS